MCSFRSYDSISISMFHSSKMEKVLLGSRAGKIPLTALSYNGNGKIQLQMSFYREVIQTATESFRIFFKRYNLLLSLIQFVSYF